jgi:hypothetical protein
MTSNNKCLIVYDKCINRKSKFPLTTKFVTKPVWIVGCLSVESMFCYAFAKYFKQQPNHSFYKISCSPS